MLTKAYIQDVLSPHSIRVRIPLYNKISGVEGATPNNELGVACVCSLPNFITNACVGDVVIVGFEEDSISKPVVLGYLSTNTEKGALVDITCNQITAKGDVVLDEHTTIGEVEPENIKCLKNLKDNINSTFKLTAKSIEEINERIVQLDTDIVSNAKSIVVTDTNVSTLQNDVQTLYNTVSALQDRCDSLLNKFDEYLRKYPTILGAGTYGTDLPSTANSTPGQVYFTLKSENEQGDN